MAGQAAQGEVASETLAGPGREGRVGLGPGEGQERRPFPQDWACLALPCANTPRTCWRVFPKRFTRASGWGRPSPLLGTHPCPGKACPQHSGLGHTPGLPQPPPQPLLPDPQPLPPLSPTCQPIQHLHQAPQDPQLLPRASCSFWLPHTLHLQVQPQSLPALSSGLCMAHAYWGGVRDFWDRGPVGCSPELRVAKSQNLTSLPHMWGHLGLVPSLSAPQAPHSWGEEKSHAQKRVRAHIKEGGCADVIAEVGVKPKPPQQPVLLHPAAEICQGSPPCKSDNTCCMGPEPG